MMKILKSLKCSLGFHEPAEYITVAFRGEEHRICRVCGKWLESGIEYKEVENKERTQ